MARAKDVPAAAEIVIVIAGGAADVAVRVAAQAAVREVTVVATPAVAAVAEDVRISTQYS